ncbi:YolD-like family protein [Bacillus pumilus]|uniref:YolD-like family protein n=1 Tax=Bacillus pumilus TaxID=1408 RepID=UPI000F876DEC|nr:YolD-like family protein [Bacillus pumilus]RST63395.1 YolD-like family protein [Bacillus pumilus]
MWNEEKDQNRWKMKIILPEHREALRQLNLAKHKIERPELSEEQIEEIEYTITTAISDDISLKFELFDNGFVMEVVGRVVHVDHIKKRFHVKDNVGDTNLIDFSNIIHVSNF